MAIQAGLYEVMNGNEPSMGNISFQKESELKEFIENFMLVLKALRYKIFDPLVPVVNDNNDEEMLYCKRKGINATGQITAEGFVVRKGRNIGIRFKIIYYRKIYCLLLLLVLPVLSPEPVLMDAVNGRMLMVLR